MGVDLSAVGRVGGPKDISWDSTDVMLYALGVGAGQVDALKELNLTTENTEGVQLQVLPTFALVVAQKANLRPSFGDVDRTKLVHASQDLELVQPLPVAGTARITARITAIEDKGSGALVTTASEGVDPATGKTMFTATASAFIRGAGGFDPNRKSSGARPASPDRKPDIEKSFATRQDQALFYRLCADRNPLHSDPGFASRGGFSRPILHGLCTYGISVRLLLQEAAGGDPSRLKSVSARFTKPVLPGETLTVQIWRDGGLLRFRTLDASGAAVLDGGEAKLAG